ncbi:helix-turn-helix domain-containing protein [Mucilaginibacter ginsenosidivorax]|uniref:Helix-turn-helix domain-containing protein n=1 Tax=Mucilaginibacter ginsenosidivorax TaxID=862126 RepID=A0A5B8W8Q4_9SPHI|nr:helix-turn-helix domain-containing protein [Mucilaginibacter ginsenosidivorax]QEC79346.1 helix-turn-helix domain-containing protein [Mucilaginibacter ginsenosidivorax]
MIEKLNPDPLLTRKEAARYLDMAPNTLAVWACTKRYNLNPIKIGRSVRYRRSELDRFLDQSLVVIQPS